MGYQIYEVGKRWGGYGVPTVCEHPDCNKEIDRGMSYACGGEPFSEQGCDRYFCGDHVKLINVDRFGEIITKETYKEEDEDDYESKEVCERCAEGKEPFDYKPEVKEWMEHLLKDESWDKWRKNNKDTVEKYKSLTLSN